MHRFTLDDRISLRSISDREADEIHAFTTGAGAGDPGLANEIKRLRDLLTARAVALAEERAWRSLSSDEQARLIDVAGKRGIAKTEEMARGLIDAQLMILVGRPMMGANRTRFAMFGFDPLAVLEAGDVLAQQGEMARRFGLAAKTKRFGRF